MQNSKLRDAIILLVRLRGHGLKVQGHKQGQGLVNWSSRTRTFLEDNNIAGMCNLLQVGKPSCYTSTTSHTDELSLAIPP